MLRKVTAVTIIQELWFAFCYCLETQYIQTPLESKSKLSDNHQDALTIDL